MTTRTGRLFILPLVFGLAVGLAAACSGSQGTPAPTGELRLVEDLRIGASSGPEEYLFGRIGGIVQHDDGSVSILDTQVPMIRHYDTEGTYLNDIGRVGQGPGEYASETLLGIQRLPDDNLALWDLGNQRITIFSPDGRFVNSFRVESGGFTSRVTLRVDHDGNFYVFTTDRSASPQDGQRPWAYLKYSPRGEQVGSIPVPGNPFADEGLVFATSEGRMRSFSHERLHTLTSGGYLAIGDNADYSFELQRDGETVLEVTHPWEPVPLEPGERAEWEAWYEYYTDSARERDRDPPAFNPLPETKPAFMDLHAGVDGTIWVRRYARARERTDRPPRAPDDPRPPLNWWQLITLDAFDEEGRFLGTVELPNDTWVAALHREWIWTVQPNEDEESVAVRYRIEGGR